MIGVREYPCILIVKGRSRFLERYSVLGLIGQVFTLVPIKPEIVHTERI